MTSETKTPQYFQGLFRPRDNAMSRKVKSIALQTWVTVLTAANVTLEADTPREALGAPIVLARNKDGSIRFNDETGKPVTRVAKAITEAATVALECFEADMLHKAGMIAKKHADAYKAEVAACQVARKAMAAKERNDLDQAVAAREATQTLLAQAQAVADATPAPELVPAKIAA